VHVIFIYVTIFVFFRLFVQMRAVIVNK